MAFDQELYKEYKMKRVTPFSNMNEFLWWKERNCDQCCRYENKSTKVENAKCRHAFYLDLASISDGMIPDNSVMKIGFSAYDGMYRTCTLKSKCNLFNKPLKKYPKKYKQQMELF